MSSTAFRKKWHAKRGKQTELRTEQTELPQEVSPLLPLNNTLMNVMESTTRHNVTEMAVHPAAKKPKSAAGSVIFEEGRRISDIVPQSHVLPLDTPSSENFKKSLVTYRGGTRSDSHVHTWVYVECIHVFYDIQKKVTRKALKTNWTTYLNRQI